jgi:hypothetical protein
LEGHSCQRLLPHLQVIQPRWCPSRSAPLRGAAPAEKGRASADGGSALPMVSVQRWPTGVLRGSGAGLRRGAARRVCRCAGAPHEEPGRATRRNERDRVPAARSPVRGWTLPVPSLPPSMAGWWRSTNLPPPCQTARGRSGGAMQITRLWCASRAVEERGLRGRPAQESVLRPVRAVRTVAGGLGFGGPLGIG